MQEYQFWLLMFSLWYTTASTLVHMNFAKIDIQFSILLALGSLGMMFKCLLF